MVTYIKDSSVPDFLAEEIYELPVDGAGYEPTEETFEEVEKPKRTTANRARITEGNARYLAFAAKFPGADSEAFSVLSERQDHAAAGQGILHSVKGTEKRLRKMEALGAIARYRDKATGVTYYSATSDGIDALWTFGYPSEHGATLEKKSKTRVSHYRFIAHVAAQFTSPKGFFRESLGIEPVPLDCLFSENEMRAALAEVQAELKAGIKKGDSADFGRWRETQLEASLIEATQGKIHWSDILAARPALTTLGSPKRDGSALKNVHQPDLAVILDQSRTDTEAKNLLVEVELSKKSWSEYRSILKTIKAELEHGFVYKRAVYFTVGTQVETLLRKVDAEAGHGLFSSGKLLVLPICDRNGNPISFSNRIELGGF